MLKTVSRNRSRIYDGVIKILRRSNTDDSGKPSSNTGGDSGKPASCPGGNSGRPLAGKSEPVKQKKSLDRIYAERVANSNFTFPIIIMRGEGIYLYDNLGNKYMDFTAGDSTSILGHCNRKVAETMCRHSIMLTQSTQYCQTYALGIFATYLTDLFGFERVIVMNSGCEAVETAIKIARKFGYKHKKIPENQAKIIVPEKSFWGKSLSAISTANDKNFLLGPHLQGFETIPFNDLKALEEKVKDPNVCGFLVEPIQVDAGVIIPDRCYLSEARRLCSQYRVLILADEVQVGLGRCGALTCSSMFSMTPDILILGKALSSGFLPVSATLADNIVMDLIDPSVFGSTYGGFPIGCFVSLSALDTLLTEKLITHSRNMGIIFRQALEAALPKECVKAIRGRGLLNAIELQGIFRGYISLQLFYELLCNGIIVKPPYDGILRLIPPLCIKESEIIHAVKVLRTALLKLKGYCEMSWEELEQACVKRIRADKSRSKSQKEQTECDENVNAKATGGNLKKPTMKSQMTQTSFVTHDKAVQCEEEEYSHRPKKSDSGEEGKRPSKKKSKKTEKGKQANKTDQEDCPDQFDYVDCDDFAAKTKGKSKTYKKKSSDECNGASVWVETSKEEEYKSSDESIPVLKSRKVNKFYEDVENSEPSFYNISSITKMSQATYDSKMRKNQNSDSDDCVEVANCQPSRGSKMKSDENKCSDPDDGGAEAPDNKKVNSNPTDCDNNGENIQQNEEKCPRPNEDMPRKSTQPVCKKFPFTVTDPSQNPLLPFENMFCEPCESILSEKQKLQSSKTDRSEDEKSQKSKSQKVDECEKQASSDKRDQLDEGKTSKYKRYDNERELIQIDYSDDEKSPKKKSSPTRQTDQKDCRPPDKKISPCKNGHEKPSSEPKKQDYEKQSDQPKPPSSEQEKHAFSKKESIECDKVSTKKTDRGKQPVTSKGIQPIPKKTSAGKKFYPQDGEVPTTSKAWSNECVKPKGGSTDKEKSPCKPKNDDCKKPSNENCEPKNSKTEGKPDSEKNSPGKNPDCSDPAFYNKTFSTDLFIPSKKK